jgi:hypothetical protein
MKERKKFEASFSHSKLLACFPHSFQKKKLKSICGEKCYCFFKSYICSWHDIDFILFYFFKVVAIVAFH